MKRIHYIVILIALAMMLCACNKQTAKQKSAYNIYYVNDKLNGIQSVPYDTDKKEQDDIIKDFLNQLQSDVSQKGMIPAIPDFVEVNGYNITQGVLTVDFSDTYYDIGEEMESLCRAAVVLTLDQIDKVDYVMFTIEKKPLEIDGEIVDAMSNNDFSSDLSGNNSDFVRADFKLFFSNDSGTDLKEYDLKNSNYAGMSKEEFVVKKLIEGPKKDGYISTLSSEVQLRSVTTVDNICYVDFGENFLTEQSPVSNRLVIYSIVNSILELTDINKVQISVEGDSNIYYHNDISLKKPFIRNLDLVEQ